GDSNIAGLAAFRMRIEHGALADFALIVEAIEHGLVQLAVMDLGLFLGHVNPAERRVVNSASFRVPERTQASVLAILSLVVDQAAFVLELWRLALSLHALRLFGHR